MKTEKQCVDISLELWGLSVEASRSLNLRAKARCLPDRSPIPAPLVGGKANLLGSLHLHPRLRKHGSLA